jgi:anti-sigma regulatory factor (Ser/Thr protein kinase)
VEHAREVFAGRLPDPTAEVQECHFDRQGLGRGPHSGHDVATVRAAVQRRAAAAGLPPSRRADLALAVTEAANNSLRHGGGKGTFRVWQDRDALTCEVRDTGRLGDLLAGRRLPPAAGSAGRGLWLVHQLTDLSQVRSSQDGTTVRITSWL